MLMSAAIGESLHKHILMGKYQSTQLWRGHLNLHILLEKNESKETDPRWMERDGSRYFICSMSKIWEIHHSGCYKKSSMYERAIMASTIHMCDTFK